MMLWHGSLCHYWYKYTDMHFCTIIVVNRVHQHQAEDLHTDCIINPVPIYSATSSCYKRYEAKLHIPPHLLPAADCVASLGIAVLCIAAGQTPLGLSTCGEHTNM